MYVQFYTKTVMYNVVAKTLITDVQILYLVTYSLARPMQVRIVSWKIFTDIYFLSFLKVDSVIKFGTINCL